MESRITKQIDMCINCYTCTSVCPVFDAWGDEATLTNAPPGFLKGYRYMEQWGMEWNTEVLCRALYDCKTCGACEQACAMSLKLTDIVRGLRRASVARSGDRTSVAGRLGEALDRIEEHGSPHGPSSWHRGEWAEEADIRVCSKKGHAALVYFIGCRSDARSRRIAAVTARLLQKAGVDFAVLGDAETCCGYVPFSLGADALFEALAEKTRHSFRESGVESVLVTSPHCYYVLKHQYGMSKTRPEIHHISRLLSDLIDTGRLPLTQPVRKVVTYHDPCYLGRHSGIYDAPRAVLRAVPGLELVEMEMCRENSLCCGGAGTEEWLSGKLERTIAIRRAKQAVAVGVDVIVTCCPSCIRMLEEAVDTLRPEKRIAVCDLVEVVEEAL
ncbi:(Fe-S)-binding protein [Chloroflexota bacterium]